MNKQRRENIELIIITAIVFIIGLILFIWKYLAK